MPATSHRKHLIAILWLLFAGHFITPSVADEPPVQEKKSGPIARIENFHYSVSSQVVGLAEDIDSYFSDDEISDAKNKSRITFRQQTLLLKSGEVTDEFRISGKLHLPGTQKRLNLFIDSSWNNSRDLTAQILNINTDREEEDKESTSIGIEWLRLNKWKIRSRLGIRARIPLEPFYRFRISRTFQVTPVWQTTLRQSVDYFQTRGWSEQSAWYWQRYLSDTLRFRTVSEIEFQDRNDYYDLAQIFALHQDINHRTTVQYSLGTLNNTDSNQNALNHFVSIDYRRRLIKKWLLISVRPQLTAPREMNYKIQPSLSIRLDLLLTE